MVVSRWGNARFRMMELLPPSQEQQDMNMKDKLIGAGAVTLAFVGLGSAAALASTSSTSPRPAVHAPASPKATEPTSATDTDQIQQGDQTSPDVPGANDQADTGKDTPEANDTADTGKEAAGEKESGVDADGPGGHQDPPGQVDNQQDGQN